jgi:hypothetical protein
LHTQGAHFFSGDFQGPGHGIDKRPGPGRAFFVDGKIDRIAVFVNFGCPALFCTYIRDGTGVRKEEVRALRHGLDVIDSIIGHLDGIPPGTGSADPLDIFSGNTGSPDCLRQRVFNGLMLIKSGQHLAFTDDLSVFEYNGFGVFGTTIDSCSYHFLNPHRREVPRWPDLILRLHKFE